MPESFPPGYLADLYGQVSSLAAVLGGFAIAALTVLLTAAPEKRVASWATGASALAAGALIASTFLSAILSTDAGTMTGRVRRPHTQRRPARDLSGHNSLGLYALLFALGLCGWIRSKRTGIASTVAALIGVVAVTAGFAATV